MIELEAPSDRAAEASLIGSWLVRPDDIAGSRVEPGDFEQPALRRLAEAVLLLHDDRRLVEAATVVQQASRGLDKTDAEAVQHWAIESASATGAGVHAQHWATIVRASAQRRRVFRACQQALSDLASPGCDATEIANSLREGLDASRGNLELRGHVSDMLDQAVHEITTKRTDDADGELVSWGIRELDRSGAFIRPGSFSVIAARPGCGKTTFMRQTAFRLAHTTSRPVIYLTLEQDPIELVIDEVLKEASVKDPAGNGVSNEDHERIESAASYLAKASVWIPQDFPNRLGPLLSWLQHHIAETKPAAVFLDYLTLIEAPGKTTYERATLTSSRLRGLARTTRTPLVVAAQLNRANVGDRREPELHDLRDSGQIEQDATSVFLLHYPWAQSSKEQRAQGDAQEGEAWLKVAKNRRGRAHFRVPMRFEGAYRRMLATEAAHA